MRGQRSVPDVPRGPRRCAGSEQLVRSKGWFATAAVLVSLALAAAPSAGTAQQPTTTPPDAGTGAAAGAPAAPSGQSLDARLRADRAELDRIRAERTELEQRMAELRSSVHDLADEIANLDRQANATARAVRTLDEQLVVINAEVQGATAKLVTAQDELAIKRAMLRHRLIDIYKRGPLYSTEALLTADSFGELVARYKYLHLLALRDQALVARVEQLGKQIARQRRALVSLQGELADNREEKAAEEGRLRALESERERSLTQAQHTQVVTAARMHQIDLAESRLGSVINALEECPTQGGRASQCACAFGQHADDPRPGPARLARRRNHPVPVRAGDQSRITRLPAGMESGSARRSALRFVPSRVDS